LLLNKINALVKKKKKNGMENIVFFCVLCGIMVSAVLLIALVVFLPHFCFAYYAAEICLMTV
jgi:hypothetical protein